MTIIKTIRKCVEGMILNDIISILLFCAFAYLFNFNFHRDNYAYAIVMFIGMMVFYGDFYHHLPINWKLYIYLSMCPKGHKIRAIHHVLKRTCFLAPFQKINRPV